MEISAVTLISAFHLVVLAAYASGARECYQCDSDDDHKSSKECKWKKPDTGKLNKIKSPDDKKECFLCYKYIDSDDDVTRGCLSKNTWKDIRRSDSFNFKKKDDCKKNGDDEVCVCEGNNCNGGASVRLSALSVLGVCLTAILNSI